MRIRLILSFTLVVLITIVSLVVIVRLSQAQTVRAFMFRGGVAGVDNLVAELEDHYRQRGDWDGAADLFEMGPGMGPGRAGMGMGPRKEMNEMMTQHLRLVDLDGMVIMDNKNPSFGSRVSADELAYAIPLEVDGQDVGYLLPEARLVFTQDNEIRLLAQLNRAAFWSALIAGCVSFILALGLSYSLLRPVRDLTQASEQLAKGNFDQRVTVRGGGELTDLGKTFNFMASSLQDAVARREALTADIAHELRTPLAVQRAHIEALQDGIYELTADALIPIEEQNQALTHLVEDLRTLALADAGQLSLEFVQVDFSVLVKRVVTLFDPQAAAQDIQLVLSPMDEPLFLRLDPQRIEQALNNLLSNALRYTPPGGSVFVGLESPSAREVSLIVRDTGPGIPQESLAHIFERFYKVDGSRNRNEGGTGLGLSISRKIAQAHGGDIYAANHPEGGAVFTLKLPKA